MSESSNWLVHDHRHYEAALEACEMAAGAGDWKQAIRLFHTFVEDFKLHMRMEDEVLYPAFVEELGDSADEVASLGEEHEEIVRLLRDLAHVIKRHDMDHFEDSLLPLHKAVSRHNKHEEQVFSAFGSNALLMRREEITTRLKSLGTMRGHRSWDL